MTPKQLAELRQMTPEQMAELREMMKAIEHANIYSSSFLEYSARIWNEFLPVLLAENERLKVELEAAKSSWVTALAKLLPPDDKAKAIEVLATQLAEAKSQLAQTGNEERTP